MQLNQENAIIQQIKNREIDLPSNYQNAIVALKQCDEIDEVKDLKDKMAAATLYYKQSKDIRLLNYATRIKLQAERRLGVLLEQFNNQGKRNDLELMDINDHKLSKKEVSKSIGLSERQTKEAIRLANIPEQKFEELIESDKVPTASQLAEIGTKKRVKEIPKNFINNVQFGLLLNDMLSFMEKFDALYILNEMDEKTKENYKNKIDKIENWFDNFIVNL